MRRIIVALYVALCLCGSAETNSVANKITLDAKSGQYAEVDAKKEVVSSYNKNGKIIWSNNVVESVKMFVGARTNEFFRVSGRKISGIQIYRGELWVDLGRGYATLDIKTGEFKGINSN